MAASACCAAATAPAGGTPPLPSLAAARAAFDARHGAAYGYGGWLDANFEKELGCRLGPGQHYLDWTGSGQYTNSQVAAALQELASTNFGNPHSRNPSSRRATQEVAAARAQLLAHFNADPEEYCVVFTKGATEALKIVAECLPWAPGASSYTYTLANHKSVLGIGAVARHAGGASLAALSRDDMAAWLEGGGGSAPGAEAEGCADGSAAGGGDVVTHLVAFPAKDNYEGQLYPLDWVAKAHAKSSASCRYLVVLDVAAFVPTHSLDLSAVKPDFVPISFYKMFGYPSGLGALLLHRRAAPLLRKTYFGGGSVDYCTAQDAWHVLSAPPAGFEDGTVGFLSIAGLKHGFRQLQQLGGMKAVEAHVECLRSWLFETITQLRHSSGAPLVRLFGRHADGPHHQSCIFQFQVLCPRGSAVPPGVVEDAATKAGLQLRSGCNCNPGICLPNLGITPEEERARAAAKHTGQLLTVTRAGADGCPPEQVQLPTGSVRVSLGYLSTFEDVHAFATFLAASFTDEKGMQLTAAYAEVDPEFNADQYC